MTNIDVMRYMMHHQQQIRNANANPSEATQAVWRLEDTHTQALLEYYEQAETADDYEVSITSEVRLK